MGMPGLTVGSGKVIRYGIYTEAAVRADPETAADVVLLEGANKDLTAKAAARRDADTAAIGTGAVLANRASALYRSAVKLGTATFGHYLSRQDEGYQRLFPVAPSQLRSGSVATRAARYEALHLAATAKETPKVLKPLVDEYEVAYAAWLTATAANKQAEADLGAAALAERKAVDEWHTAARRLKGRLTERFPRDSNRVNGYFPSMPIARKKPVELVAAPAVS